MTLFSSFFWLLGFYFFFILFVSGLFINESADVTGSFSFESKTEWNW